MSLTSIAVFIIALAVVALVAALIPAINQLKNTLSSTTRFVDNLDASIKTLLDDEVKPLVRSVNNTVYELEGVVREAKEGLKTVDEIVQSLRGVGETVRSINSLFDTKVKGTLIDLAAYITGLKVGILTFFETFKSQKKEVA
jgi:uncharacterized protein YoxC